MLTRRLSVLALSFLVVPTQSSRAQCVTAEDQSWFPADGGALDQFGHHVSVDGEFAAIAAEGDDDIALNSGAVYIYRRIASGDWVPFQKLKAADAGQSDLFGSSIDLHDHVLAIGAIGDSDAVANRGAAYVFRYNGTTFNQEAKLVHGDPEAGDTLGNAISVHDDTIVVASDNKQVGFGDNAGAVYAFRHVAGAWTQEQKILAPDAAAFDFFGFSIDLCGNRLIVGAIDEDGAQTNQGSVYIFRRGGTVWSLEQKVAAGDPSAHDQYGYSVAIDDETVAVGANHHDGFGNTAGAVYVYRFTGGQWALDQKLISKGTQPFDQFGTRVALDDTLLAAYSPLNDLAGTNSGASYLFRYAGAVWVEQTTLIGTGINAGDDYGEGLALDGSILLIGAPGTGPFGGSSGSCYAHRISDLTLDTQPDLLPAGTPFDLFVCGGVPTDLVAVLITDVLGQPVFLPLFTAPLNADGGLQLPGVMPLVPSLSGGTVALTAFALGPFGSTLMSNEETLFFP